MVAQPAIGKILALHARMGIDEFWGRKKYNVKLFARLKLIIPQNTM